MKSIVFKITLAVSLLVLLAFLLETYLTGGMMAALFYEYMSEAATANDPYPIVQGGKIIMGPAEKSFINTIYSELLWIDLPLIFLTFIVSYLIARDSTKSIRKLSRGAKEIAKGNLGHKVDIREGGEIGALASAFNSMADELAGAQALRKQFFADAAHELKTPIAVIKGNLEGMLDGVIPTDKGSLNSLLEETDFLDSMIGDIKYLALADSGQLKLDRRDTNVNDIVRACASQLETAAKARKLTISTDLKDEPLNAFVDGERIRQIIYNLMINAGKYTPEGGSVGVRTERALDNNTECVKVTVWDTGIGIPEADIPRVFDRFYRTDRSRDRKTGGFGLGLAIVKKLTELHGGRVYVTSELGKGSNFYIVLPIGGTNA